MNNFPVTVLMSVFDENTKFLKGSIDSILNQTFKNFEFLIIDDGSSNKKCLKLLKQYEEENNQIRLIHNKKNLGLTKSLNKGLKLAKGKFIARIDSDDLADTRRIEKQLQFMEQNSNHALCGSWAKIIDENNKTIGFKKFPTIYKEIRRKILYFNFFTHSSLFFNRKLILSHGGYNEDIKKAQDYDLILKISARYPIANIPEPLCIHRLRSESISAKGKKKQEYYGIIARWRAIFEYGYPKTYVLKIIPALFYFIFIPYWLEKGIFKLLWYK